MLRMMALKMMNCLNHKTIIFLKLSNQMLVLISEMFKASFMEVNRVDSWSIESILTFNLRIMFLHFLHGNA